MRRRPRGVGVEMSVRQREREQRRAGQRGDRMRRAPSRHGFCRDWRARGGDGLRRLRHGMTPSRQHEARTEIIARPVEHRIPSSACRSTRPPGRRRDRTGDRSRGILRSPRPPAAALGHAVDDRIGEPRQRHARRIDHVCLRIPFVARSPRPAPRRRRKLRAAPASSPACRRAARQRGPRLRRILRQHARARRTASASAAARRAAPTPSDRAAGCRKSR